MTEKDFISHYPYNIIEKGNVSAKCGSNIALVKYWGKYTPQLPANPSISFTLTQSFTETTISFEKSENFAVEVFLDNLPQVSFAEKNKKYFSLIKNYLPFIDKYKYTIHTHNSFPHSSGIASSASGFGAIALCLMDICKLLGENISDDFKTTKASFLARLGSGSACRSLYNGLTVWGEHKDIANSSNLYAVPYPHKVNSVFNTMQDSVLLIHEGQKEISSTVGHNLMNNHPYASTRFQAAHKNLHTLSTAIQNGDLETFGKVIEHEALSLHAMMMMSDPAFILMQPATLAAINKIWNFRKQNNVHLYFTLDAGANIHLIYPESDKGTALDFITNDLVKYTENGKVIFDNTLL